MRSPFRSFYFNTEVTHVRVLDLPRGGPEDRGGPVRVRRVPRKALGHGPPAGGGPSAARLVTGSGGPSARAGGPPALIPILPTRCPLLELSQARAPMEQQNTLPQQLAGLCGGVLVVEA